MTTDIILFAAGLMVGGMNAIAGGGTLVAFPILLALGLPALSANATSYISVLPGQVGAGIGYRQYLRRAPKAYLWLLIPCILGAATGSYLLRHSSFAYFEQIIPMLIVLAVAMFALQPLLHFHLMRPIRSGHLQAKNLGTLSLVLFIMTIYGGYFGAGLGFALLALMSFANLRDIHTMNAMKAVAAAAVVTTAIMGLSGTHLINWQDGLVMAAGSTIGGYGGSRLAQRVPSHLIRMVVVLIGLGTAAHLAIQYH